MAANYDAFTGRLTLYLDEWPLAPSDQFIARHLKASAAIGPVIQAGPLRIGADRTGPRAAATRFEKPGNRFNRRIQDARISKSALTAKGALDN